MITLSNPHDFEFKAYIINPKLCYINKNKTFSTKINREQTGMTHTFPN